MKNVIFCVAVFSLGLSLSASAGEVVCNGSEWSSFSKKLLERQKMDSVLALQNKNLAAQQAKFADKARFDAQLLTDDMIATNFFAAVAVPATKIATAARLIHAAIAVYTGVEGYSNLAALIGMKQSRARPYLTAVQGAAARGQDETMRRKHSLSEIEDAADLEMSIFSRVRGEIAQMGERDGDNNRSFLSLLFETVRTHGKNIAASTSAQAAEAAATEAAYETESGFLGQLLEQSRSYCGVADVALAETSQSKNSRSPAGDFSTGPGAEKEAPGAK